MSKKKPSKGKKAADETENVDPHAEETLRVDDSRWSGFRDGFGEREIGIDAQGFSIELLRLRQPFDALELPLSDRILHLVEFDSPAVTRPLRIDREEGSARLVLVSERAIGNRLSDLLNRGTERSVIADLGAGLFITLKLLRTAASLHAASDTTHFAVGPSRIVITPRGEVVLAEAALGAAIEALGVLPPALKQSLGLAYASSEVDAAGPRLDIARIALVGLSMMLGRPLDPLEDVDPFSPVIQELGEVAALRAGNRFSRALVGWVEHAITIDSELSFQEFYEAARALEGVQQWAESPCPASRAPLRRYLQDLEFDEATLGELHVLEADRIREIRARRLRRTVAAAIPDLPEVENVAAEIFGQPLEVYDPTVDIFNKPIEVRELSAEILEQPVAFQEPFPDTDEEFTAPVAVDQVSVFEETETVDEAPALAEEPVGDHTPVYFEEAPAVEEAIEEGPVVEEALPAFEETPVFEETAVFESSPILADSPVYDETPVVEETSIADFLAFDAQAAEPIAELPVEEPIVPDEPAPVEEPLQDLTELPVIEWPVTLGQSPAQDESVAFQEAQPEEEQERAASPVAFDELSFLRRFATESPAIEEPSVEEPAFASEESIASEEEPLVSEDEPSAFEPPREEPFVYEEPIAARSWEPLVEPSDDPLALPAMEEPLALPPAPFMVQEDQEPSFASFEPEPAIVHEDPEPLVDAREWVAALEEPLPNRTPEPPAPPVDEPVPEWIRAAVEQITHAREERPPAAPAPPPFDPPQPDVPMVDLREWELAEPATADEDADVEPPHTSMADIAREMGLTLERPLAEPPPPAPPPAAAPLPPVATPPPAAPIITTRPEPVRPQTLYEPPARPQTLYEPAVQAPAPVPKPAAVPRQPRASVGAPIAASIGRLLKVAATLVVIVALLGGLVYAGMQYYARSTAPGTVVIESKPAGAEILIDGAAQGVTPKTLQLPAGAHTLELRRRGLARQFTLNVEPGGTVKQTLDWSTVRPVGTLTVTTTPPGAKVIVDGRERGVTPLTIADLPAGTRRVVLESASGTLRRDVRIEVGRTATLDEAIFSGFIAVFAPVQLRIYEGKRLIGTSENERIMMPAGRHQLEIVNEETGFRETRTVDVAPGQTVAVNVTDVTPRPLGEALPPPEPVPPPPDEPKPPQ